jgi:hypothetical protein
VPVTSEPDGAQRGSGVVAGLVLAPGRLSAWAIRRPRPLDYRALKPKRDELVVDARLAGCVWTSRSRSPAALQRRGRLCLCKLTRSMVELALGLLEADGRPPPWRSSDSRKARTKGCIRSLPFCRRVFLS